MTVRVAFLQLDRQGNVGWRLDAVGRRQERSQQAALLAEAVRTRANISVGLRVPRIVIKSPSAKH